VPASPAIAFANNVFLFLVVLKTPLGTLAPSLENYQDQLKT
jgi:hypothetical protein